MENFNRSLGQYYQVKKELLIIAQHLDSCDRDEKELYQDIALCYSKHLRELHEILKNKYNLNICS